MSLLLLVTLITIFNAVSIQRICAWLFPSASFAQTVFLFITGSCVVSVLSITSVLVLLWRNLNKAQPLPVNWAAPLPWMFFPWALKGRDKINKMLNLAYPPFLRVLELSYQGLVSACLGLVVKYQVPDLLAEEEGKSIQDLAHLIGLPSDLLGRIMRVLLSQGLFKCEGKRWYNNYLSEILRKDHPQSFAAVVQLTGDEFIKQIAHFEDFLKEYPTRPESIASWSVYNHRYKKSFWEHLSEPEQQEKLRMFNEAMLCISRVNNEIYLQDFPWDEQVVMDIGGGLGGFLADILYRFPSYRGVLFDFEGTIQQAQQIWKEKHPTLLERVEFQSGSFFDQIPLPTFINTTTTSSSSITSNTTITFILRHILHDWNDEMCLVIMNNLKKAAKAAHPHKCKVVVFDHILDRHDPLSSMTLSDLVMMISPGGKERSIDEWKTLGNINRIHPTRSFMSGIEFDLLPSIK